MPYLDDNFASVQASILPSVLGSTLPRRLTLQMSSVVPTSVSRVGRITPHPDHLLLLKQAKSQHLDLAKKGGSNLSGTQARKF